MSDRSFGDHAFRNVVKNPLLSTSVTGLSIEDLTHNAVLLPAVPTQEMSTRRDEREEAKPCTLAYSEHEIANLPSGDTNFNIYPPNTFKNIDPNPANIQNVTKNVSTKEISTSNVSKASVKTDDDFDVNEYIARLQGTRYVSAPLNTILKEEQNANLQGSEENLEEINLNEPEKVQNQDHVPQSITADIAQNFSQLPTVLPQMASVVFNSFSNMLSMKSREQTPDDANRAHDGGYGLPEVRKAHDGNYGQAETSVPVMGVPDMVKEIALAPPLKEPPPVGTANYRITTRKKVYAQIPGLSTRETAQNIPTYNQSPIAQLPHFVPDVNAYGSTSTSNDNERTTEIKTSFDAVDFNAITSGNVGEVKSSVYDIFAPTNKGYDAANQAFPYDDTLKIDANSSEDLSKFDQVNHIQSQFLQSTQQISQPLLQEASAPPVNIAQGSSTVIPPPPMFSNLPKKDSQAPVGKTVLPPSVARRIAANQPILKSQPATVMPQYDNIFIPQNLPETVPNTPMPSNLNESQVMSSTVSYSEMRPATVNLQEKATTFKPVDTSQITPFSLANSTVEVLHHSSELPQPLNAEAIHTKPNEGAKIPSTGAHILLQTTLGISHSLDVKPETLYSMDNTSQVLPSSTTTNMHQQRATSDTVNITPPSFFNPRSVQENNNLTDKPGISELNAAQFFSPNAAPPAPTTSIPDPPRISGSTNYRMTKKKPQYYSGPIEGVGSISNNIKPVLNPIQSNSFKGALFTPPETMQPHTESMPSHPDNVLVGQIPFDNFTQQVVPPSNDHCNPILNLTAQDQPQTNYNTVFDLSRPASDRFEPPQQEAIGFGIIGSLKSKLSSIDIGKFQNTVTTFFDPAYNDIKTPMTNSQGNQSFEPYYHNTGTASKSQLQGQTACLDMFVVPNVEPIYSKAHDVGFQATKQNENIYTIGNQSTYAQTFQNDPTEQGLRLNPHMEYYKEHGDTTSSPGAFDSKTYTENSFNINRPPTVGNIKKEDNKNNESHAQILFGLGSNADSSVTPKESTSEPPNEAQRRKAYDDFINQSLKNLVEDVCVIEPSESDSPTNIQESHSINTVHNNDNITQYFSSHSCNDNVLKGDNNSKNIIGGSTSESSKIYQPQSMSDNVPRLAGRVKSVSIYKSEQEQATSNVCDWFDRSCETSSTSILQNQQENKEGEVNNVNQFIVFSSGEPLIETPQRIVYDHPINEMNIPEKDIKVIEPQCTYAPSESNFDYGYNSDYVAQYYSAHTVHSSVPYSDNVLKYTDSSKNTPSEVKNSVPVLPPRIKSITVYKDSQNVTTTTSNWVDQAAGNSFSPIQQANTGLTNLIEPKTDVKEVNDVTKQLIENIIAPIQLSNPVEVPLTETNVIVDNDPQFCPGQLAEISHITEETIATLQVQSATKLLQDSNVDDTIRKCYGWRAEEAVIPRALGDHIYSIKPDPNSIGLLQNTFFDNVLTNASDELKAECKDSLDDHVVLPRQMSIPTAPPAEEDSKSDEGVLDVLSIEQDAIGNDFVIEQETDDRKMMVRERTSDEQDQEDDTFTNRVEKYKQLEETTAEEIKDGYTKPLNKPFPSYLDTGNFAAENHYKNSAHPGLIPYTLPIMRIPPGFEQEYYKRISLSNQNYLQPETYVDENISSILENELGNLIGCIENENENVPQIPDTTTQTRITPTVSICQALLSDTVVTSSSILHQISYSSTEKDDSEQVLHGKNIYQDSNKETSRSPVDDIDHQSVLSSKNIEESTNEQHSLENTDSLSRLTPSLSNLRANSSCVIKGASDVEDTRQNRLSTSEVVNNDNMLPGAFNLFNSPYSHEVITASSSIDRQSQSPTNVTESPAPINASAVKLENDGNSHSALMRQTNNNETALPDPASFFSIESTSTTISKNVDVDEEEQYNFSRLSSYFSAPPATKADHSKSFFELSQSQNHYRQNQPAQNSSQSLQQSVTSFFGSNTSNIQLQEKTIHGDTQNVTELNNYLTNLNLVRELASTKNFIPQNVVTTANYFTVHYDIGNSFHSTVREPNCLDVSEHFSHSSSNKKNDLDKSTQLGELGETETIDDTYIINNCKHCCDMTTGKIVKIDINSVVTNDKVNHVMDSDTENKGGDTETNMMEESKDIKKKTGHTVNFDTSSLQEDPNEAVSMISESRPTSEYSPVKFHWFYRIDVEGKSVWRGFSMTDSRALERSFNSPDLNENTVVATDGGRFDVNVVGRLRVAVYWPDKPTNVRRCSWFYKGTTDARYVPYTESVAEKLEEEYRHGMTTGEWHRRLMLPNNEMVVMHGPAVMVHFLQTTNDAFNSSPLFSFGKRVYRNPPKITVSQDQTGKIDHLILLVHGAGEYRNQKEKAKVQSMMRPRVVRRGCAESEIEESEPTSIDHLLLLCHGVGSACDMRFRAVEEVGECEIEESEPSSVDHLLLLCHGVGSACDMRFRAVEEVGESEIEESEPSSVDHLLLLCHGVGSACDMRFRAVEEVGECEIEESEPSSVDHLLLLCHGVGSACDMRFRAVEEVGESEIEESEPSSVDHLLLLCHGVGSACDMCFRAVEEVGESEIEESEPTSIDHLLLLCHGVGSACDMRFRAVEEVGESEIEESEPSSVDHLLLLCHGVGSACDMRFRAVEEVGECEIEESEPSSVDHLLLLCHGVGSACDMRFRAVEEVVDDFRATSLQLLQSHYRNSYDNGLVGRIEVLPISWHASLHSCETGVDRRLGAVTLDSIPRLRSFTNDTILDVLFYTSPPYCQYILDTVCKELNRIYSLFKTRNPEFRGGVSLGGHSLGSVILYDLLCHQAPLKEPKLLPRSAEKQLVEGCASAGQPALNYPRLEFEPAALYALGSPIAIFECIRGVEVLGKDFCLPNCKKFFNVFHPYDPIAYRLEPMVNPELRDVKPQLIPHHKGRKRMHLELKDTMARVGADIKQKIIESIRSTWTSMWKSDAPPDTHLEKVVEEEIEKELEEERKDDIIEAMAQATPEMLGRLNGGRRVDYVLQEAPFEMINEYLFAMRSHVCYWESEDTMLLILREVYDSLGVQPDCSVPQPGMTVQRTRTVPADEVIVTSTDSPSTSRGSS